MEDLVAWPIFEKKKRKLQIQVNEGESLRLAILKIILAEQGRKAANDLNCQIKRLRINLLICFAVTLVQSGILIMYFLY